MNRLTCVMIGAALACGAAVATTTGGTKLDARPDGAVDLTDDTDNRASISGNDNLNNSKGATAFNNDHGLDGGTASD